MDMAVADGLTMLRCFAFATNPQYPMQTSPGVYNEAIFRGLDYALDQARQRGLKARRELEGPRILGIYPRSDLKLLRYISQEYRLAQQSCR